MPRTCLLTDSAAQFPNYTFSGQEHVRVVSYDVQLNGITYPGGGDLKASDLPNSAGERLAPGLISPTRDSFAELFLALGKEFDSILTLVQSDHLSRAYENASAAATSQTAGRDIVVVNSQTTSVGQGILVQLAAEALAAGASFTEIEHLVRRQIPHIYTLICTPGLSYLFHAGLVEHAQAVAGELLNFITVYSLEEERLTPLEKVRNYRNTIEVFTEFLEEFDKLNHIALIQGAPPLISETRSIRQFFQDTYPETTYSEHNLNLPLSIIFGPRVIGLVAAEQV